MTEPAPIPLDALTTRAGHLTEQVLERLAAERRDGIPDDEPGLRAAADLHLVGCERCRAAIDQLAGDALALPPLPALTSPTSVRVAAAGRAPNERVPRHRPRSHWWAALGALALAAVALILVDNARPRPTATSCG
ncbi:MAG: hypothetical protein U1F43_12845 [Myxococcota bacterium]